VRASGAGWAGRVPCRLPITHDRGNIIAGHSGPYDQSKGDTMNTIKLADVLDQARAGAPLWVVCGDSGLEGWLSVTAPGPVGFLRCLVRPYVGPGVPVRPGELTLVTSPRGWLIIQ